MLLARGTSIHPGCCEDEAYRDWFGMVVVVDQFNCLGARSIKYVVGRVAGMRSGSLVWKAEEMGLLCP